VPSQPSPGTAPSKPLVAPGLVLAVVILCWGLGPPVSKLITAPAVIAVTYRFWLSFPILYLLCRLTGHPLRRSTLKRCILPGALFGINLVFVFMALSSATVAVLSVVAALQPGMILLVAGPFLGERPRAWHVAWTLVGIGGTALVVLGAGGSLDASALGLVYALASQATFTVYFLLTKHVRSLDPGLHPLEWMAGVSLFAALTVTPWALLTSTAADYRAVAGIDWLWLAFIIGVTGIAGHALMVWTHAYIAASRSSLYLLLMNVVAIAAAWPIHDEPLTAVQGLGGLIVLGAVAAVVPGPSAPATKLRSGPPASQAARGAVRRDLTPGPGSPPRGERGNGSAPVR
jgi:drug/metabolite transporter (DMT)-like permease